jgi:hypothetical protein
MTVGEHRQARNSFHGLRRVLALCLLLGSLTSLQTACGSEAVGTVTPPARVPSSAGSARARHGFDPREYYEKRALSVQRGAASFYADRFQGRMTANGERSCASCTRKTATGCWCA